MNALVKHLCESLRNKELEVGAIVLRPDGYKVKIISGQYYGTYGVSNFWYWRRILKSGKLSKKEYCGYGW